MNVLITGGAGYIGTELVRRLAALESVGRITVYDNLSRGNYNLFIGPGIPGTKHNKIHFVSGDLLDSRKLRKSLQDVDIVYHLAAKVATPFSNEDSHFFEQVNHWGTAELVYAVEDSSVQQLVFTSSMSVYGSSAEMLDENSFPHPETQYGFSKLRAESHVRRLSNKHTALILRCGNVYGYSPSMRFDAVINRFMFDANFNGRMSIHGNGRQYRSFIHVDKLISALAQLTQVNVPSGTYNLTDKNLQLLDLVELMKELYPDLEFIFINQHLTLKELQVSPESRLRQYIRLPQTDLREELLAFQQQFAFGREKMEAGN
jgi:UDP-glucose 4-epimerase